MTIRPAAHPTSGHLQRCLSTTKNVPSDAGHVGFRRYRTVPRTNERPNGRIPSESARTLTNTGEERELTSEYLSKAGQHLPLALIILGTCHDINRLFEARQPRTEIHLEAQRAQIIRCGPRARFSVTWVEFTKWSQVNKFGSRKRAA